MEARFMFLAGIFLIGLLIFRIFESPDKTEFEESQLNQKTEVKPDLFTQEQSQIDRPSPHVDKPDNDDIFATGFSAEETKLIMLVKARFNSGDYHTSLKMIETHLKEAEHSDAFLQWMENQLKAVLTATGWMKINTGKCEGAIADFERAIEYGKNRVISKGLAFCYHQLRLWDDAYSEVKWYLEREPQDIVALNLLADVLESSRSYGQAVQVLEDAIDYSKNEKDTQILSKKLSAMRKKAGKSQFQQLSQSRHFSLLFHGEVSNQLANKILDTLEKAHDELIERWSMKALRGPVEVVIYPQDTFTDIMEGGPHWLGGVFDGRIRIPLIYRGLTEKQFWENLETTLRHELVHAVFSDMTRRRALPPWFEEGVAQRFTCEGAKCNVLSTLPTPGSFFAESDFVQSFTQYGAQKAVVIYKQSLYLILCLEHYIDAGALRTVIERITNQSPLDSNSILRPIGTSFENVLKIAEEKWELRKGLVGRGR